MRDINQEIKRSIDIGLPNTFGKIGATEADYISYYLKTGNVPNTTNLCHGPGIYVENKQEFIKWTELFSEAVKNLDYVLEWCPERGDKFILDKVWNGKERFKSFDNLEPFTHLREGWHYSLSNKKVLVLSPFEKTIYKQVERYSKIWEGAEIGDVEVIKAPFSPILTGENPVKFLEIHEDLKQKIQNSVFDFAIVGVGGFSLPLLKVIRDMKKPGIHMGGATQIVFGICGGRWDNNKKFKESTWYNKNGQWIRPLQEEVPKNMKTLENGCYW